MTIICGIDFSAASMKAVEVAGAWARASETPLSLVHAFDVQSSRKVLAAAQDVLLGTVREDLERETQRLRKAGTEVEPVLLMARPDEAIVEHADQIGASLIVVSAIGWRSAERWTLGSVAERTVQHANQPVLVVRDEHPFLEWLQGHRDLRVMVAMAFTTTSDRAIHWVDSLRHIAPCEAAVAHVFWPADSDQDSSDPADAARARVTAIEQHLEQLGEDSMGIEVVMNASSPATALIEVAVQNQVDLLVVGERKRRQRTVLWQGSIPYSLLHLAPMSVAIVPVG